MATTDSFDSIYPSSEIEILTIDNKIDSLARQWLVRVQTSFWQFDAAVRTRVTWFNDQKYNPLRIYEGILPHYAALRAELDSFKRFLDDNEFPKTSSYYQYLIAYNLYYEGYADVAKPPALVQEELDKGRIVGICDKVDDGDTIFVNGKEIRLTGINSVEKGNFRGQAATERMKELVLGKTVTAYFDPNVPLEMYRRLLAAVYLGDGDREDLYLRPDWKSIFVNYIMVNECLAEPNDKGRNMYIDPDMLKGAWQKCKLADSPDMVRVHFKSTPTHARLYIDGKDMATSTPDFVDLSPGKHHFVLAADGFSAWHEDITVGFGDNKIFRKLLALPVAVGMLSIFTTPDDCEIIMNDMMQGIAPLIGVQMLSSAPVTITAVKDGYQSKTLSIVPMAGRNIDITFDPLQKL